MRILLTGGAGYIGSHTALALMEQNHEVTIIDDLSNGSVEAIRRVEKLAGRSMRFIKGDLNSPADVRRCFECNRYDAVIHFAGVKAVGESTEQPLHYYRVNLGSTLNLLTLMREYKVNKLVFSSSATVYGKPQSLFIDEGHPVGTQITNPYGWSKVMNEQIISDVAKAWPDFSAVNLRYFNPVGAHSSGIIGEDPQSIPNNLMPIISQTAGGQRDRLVVFGDDYDTPDGTGVRDYIHVMDLAEGHVAALSRSEPGVRSYNLGTGQGTSVLQAIRIFEETTRKNIPYIVSSRRPGDVASVIADPRRAEAELRWKAQRSFSDACRDAWKWQSRNPMGYGSSTTTA